jgi:predicted DNA-binding ribbon-helix-helix protein
MCKIFSDLDPALYEFQTRSVRLSGHSTSIRLEVAFWTTLETIARAQGTPLGRLLTKLHDEVLEFRGEAPNFASLLRCACLKYVDEVQSNAALQASLNAQARTAFAVNHRDATATLRKSLA